MTTGSNSPITDVMLKAKALYNLLQVSCPQRLRNSEYLRHNVEVQSEGLAFIKDYSVELKITLRKTGMPLVDHDCTCMDHGKAGACKHVLAFAYTKLQEFKQQWNKE